MKAAVLYKLREPLVVEEIDIPKLKEGQVLVKLAYSGVCRSQLMEVRGKRGDDRFLPHLLGHEGSGIVVETGPGVKKVRKGDRVVLGWIKGTGMDVPGCTYRRGDAVINSGGVTTFSEYSVVSENRCVQLPDFIPMDVAVLFGCAVPTGAGIVINQVSPVEGSSVAIFGLGGIGMSALMAVKLFRCGIVIAVDMDDRKLSLAESFSATHVINTGKENPLERIMAITGGKGLDYAVDASGSVTMIETAFASVRKNGGLCVFASHPEQGEKIQLDPHELISGKRIEGSWGGACRPDSDIPKFSALYKNGDFPLEKLLDKRYPLEKINNALDDLEKGKIIRALIEIDKGIK
ncbi:MAG: acetoin dehydrogenase [Spirochaetae bacterium HGW-Spirochaetae-5]|jgi:S-(hydroxymethyl)glutathione dehydrogenase/alcohol dehydrogenase|nr:MAG: acetoin dehydrogenase [Spirochaetae bacterium HGW-Spirochaetae-5]